VPMMLLTSFMAVRCSKSPLRKMSIRLYYMLSPHLFNFGSLKSFSASSNHLKSLFPLSFYIFKDNRPQSQHKSTFTPSAIQSLPLTFQCIKMLWSKFCLHDLVPVNAFTAFRLVLL
jgi:hypothetical protein